MNKFQKIAITSLLAGLSIATVVIVIIYSSRGNVTNVSNIPPPPPITKNVTGFQDDFSYGSPYTLEDGQVSPNGKWYEVWDSDGKVDTRRVNGTSISSSTNSIAEHHNNNNNSSNDPAAGSNNNKTKANYALHIEPRAPTSKNETHSVLVLSTSQFKDFKFSVDMRLEKQLRKNSPPNAWETGWILWRYIDDTHHYYFAPKPNGVEIGKYDGGTNPHSQIVISSETKPNAPLGQWTHVEIIVKGHNITAYVNGIKAFDINDVSSFNTGKIGLYCEDSEVSFDNVSVEPLQGNQ